jgi:shikimate kinase
MTPRAVLIGLPGVGKSTTGRRLAKIFGLSFADSDDLIEAATGRTVRQLFDERGEAAFRALEAAAVDEALHTFDGILALGGGALTTESTRAALVQSAAPVVVLRARVATLLNRVGDASSRPLLAGDPAGRLRELADERTAVYAELADLAVDTDGRTTGQVAATLAARLHDRARTLGEGAATTQGAEPVTERHRD